ncbi:hypothetical protein BKA64DRAFT_581224, partial [Cadophora sp. MPI-SDFR-AT-0126]
QYVTLWKKDIIIKFMLQISKLEQPIQIKFILSIAFSVSRQRSKANRPLKPPRKN